MGTVMDKQQPIFWQTTCILAVKPRGFHLITDELLAACSAMPFIKMGLANLFLQHTSASLAISENTCHDVRLDLETYFNKTIPDDNHLYHHTLEGDDDMPAHIKNVLLGSSVTIPISDNKLALGQWQGIYLCEHRNSAPARKIVITVQGLS